MVHALTIDVEDYWAILSRDWLGGDHPVTDAVERNTDRFLAILGEFDAKATFFILGEVARSHPALIRRIAEAGHEVGVHGDRHKPLFKLTPARFAQEVRDARKAIEDAAGMDCRGHRAPAFSIMPDTRWGLNVLAESGFNYDSSIYPIAGARYGWPGFSETITRLSLPGGGRLIEAPMSAVRVLGKALPACGGGYMRHFPYLATRWAMRHLQKHRPVNVYMHPYEVDTAPGPVEVEQAIAQADAKTRKFHRIQIRNRKSVEPKLRKLLREFAFGRLDGIIDRWLSDHPDAETSIA